MLKLLVILSAFSLCTVIARSQQPAPQQLSSQPAETVIIKPKLSLGDVRIIAVFIGSVDIRGNEVDAFLDVKNTLTKAAESAAKMGKTDADVITLDMRLDTAQNFFLLMQRATLKAADAEKFKSIITAIQDAAREVQGAQR